MPNLLVGTGRALFGGASRGILYLLYDTFATALAAGSVNGTASEPGANALANAAPTRTVVDTTSKLSHTGGQLSMTGQSVWGDPGEWSQAQARVLGKVLIQEINFSTLSHSSFGWDSNQSGQVIEGAFYQNSTTNLQAYDGGSGRVVAPSLVVSTAYKAAFALRTAGCFLFMKGGIYTNWTLLWVGVNGVATPVYAGAGNNAAAIVHDNWRIPQPLYIPNPLAYDTFTRANGALGSTETAGPDAQVIVALAYTFTAGVWTVATNKAVATPVLLPEVIVNGAFATDTDWTEGAGWTIGAGTAIATAASSDLTAAVAPLATSGAWYQVTYTVGGYSAGNVGVLLGTSAKPTHAANGTYTETGRTNTDGSFVLRGVGFTGTIDNVSCKQLPFADLFSSVSVSTQDVIVDVAITLSGGTAGLQAGVVLNLDSVGTPANYVIAYLNGNGSAVLEKYVANVMTNVIAAAVTYSAGAVLRVIKSGTSYSLFYNNLAVGTVQTISDANIINQTSHGLFSTSPSNSLDGFTLWSRGSTDNAYATLDGF